MTQTRWGQVKNLFEKVADLSRSGRDRFLAQPHEAPSVAAEVRILVEADGEAGAFMQSAVLALPSAALPLKDGDLVSGRYRITGLLGTGGMGVVYRAEDTILSRPVALKFLHGEAGNRQPLERMKREARAAAALNHPNICVVYEIGEHQSFPFIAMELLEGETLRERVAGRPIATGEFLDWAIQIAGAVEAAHSKGIIHRDLKPANIYITTHGQAKLLDFGLANSSIAAEATSLSSSSPPRSEQTLTTRGFLIGTVPYMSPEQARGEVLDARSDLFSFGAVLYEMATGK
jgi:non-specific serine/threonine protein kinase